MHTYYRLKADFKLIIMFYFSNEKFNHKNIYICYVIF